MLGIIGGSGFYKFLDQVEERRVDTPFGAPSAPLMVGKYQGRQVVFLPRHGIGHTIPPHKINYCANLWALKQIGVDRVLGPCAVGSLQPHIKPGEFLIIDQFVDRTRGRKDTFYDGKETAAQFSAEDVSKMKLDRVAHVSSAEPYCPELSKLAFQSCQRLDIPAHEKGTVAVIQGPRFSTKAESRWFSKMGWEIINMTQYPEAILARELEMCYASVALVTDYDVGLEGQPEAAAVTNAEVLRVFKENNEKLGKLLFDIIVNLPETKKCLCGEAMKGAFI